MISKSFSYHKNYKSTGAYKKKRIAKRARLEYEHHLLRSKESLEQDYIKGQTLEQWHTYAHAAPGPCNMKAIFHGCKNDNFSRIFLLFSYFFSKHRLWVHVSTHNLCFRAK